MMLRLVLLLSLVLPMSAHSATYYISPSGSNGNSGLSTASPFLTFAYAINAARAWCGDTLIVLNGVYGDGTSTGKLSLSSVVCTLGNELTILADNARQAKISDNGTGYALRVQSSAYVNLYGLYTRSTDNDYLPTSTAESGETFFIQQSHHIMVIGNIAVNPNRYGNNHTFVVFESQDVLLEDNESYVYSRHCVSAGSSTRIVVRRHYCNARGGKISGGFSAGGQPLGSGDAVMSMYPCRDCILENSIADCTESPTFINEQNANYASSVLVKGNKVLGNISYDCDISNGIVPNARNVADLNHTPQDVLVRDNVFVRYRSSSPAILFLDCVNCTADHNTVMGLDVGTSAAHGIRAGDQSAYGATPAQANVTFTNNMVKDRPLNGFMVSGVNTWSGNNNRSFSNGTAFSPAAPSNWGTTYTNDPGYGTCHGLWVPDGSVGKGQGTGGSDIGANILYRYVNGVLTTTPLWDPNTGAFPFGAADRDGVNRVAGKSLFDLHTRMGVKTGGCPFPSGYATGGGPTNPSTVVASTDLTGPHVHTVDSGMDSLTTAIMTRRDGVGAPAYATGLTSSCGSESHAALAAPSLTTSPSGGNRSLRLFGKINPTAGTCTLTPTFSDANWDGWVMVSVEKSNVGSYGPVASTNGLTDTPTVTVATNPDETVLGFVATSNVPTLNAGPNQTLTTDLSHSTKVLRAAASEKSGATGGLVDVFLSNAVYAATQGVSLIPPSPGGGTGSTFRVINYRIDSLHGTHDAPEVTVGPLGNQNQATEIGITGAFRIRAEVLVEGATSTETGIALYCRNTGIGTWISVLNTFGSGSHLRYYGQSAQPTIPATLTRTTERFAGGPFASGYTVSDDSVPIVLPAMPANTSTELDFLLVGGNGFAPGDTEECQIRLDDGSTFGVHTVTPTVIGSAGRGVMGF